MKRRYLLRLLTAAYGIRVILRLRLDPVAIGAIADVDGGVTSAEPVAIDPPVWSGRAMQEVRRPWLMWSCITVSGLCLERLLRAIMDISAHTT
jgi:hypothetical protein